MHLDKYNLPVQADGDANDQLNRVGLICQACIMSGGGFDNASFIVRQSCYNAITFTPSLTMPGSLLVGSGTYVRSVGNSPDNVSADQLIPVLAYFVYSNWTFAKPMRDACLKRWGFAQNTKDGIGASTKCKIPDFMLLRAAPLFLRIKTGSIFRYLADLYLILMVLGVIIDRNPDSVDDNCTISTLVTCVAKYPTFVSKLAAKLYAKYRPWNYGCVETGEVTNNLGQVSASFSNNTYYTPAYGAVRWYHRTEAGGNPEIALLWKPVIDKYLGGSQNVRV